MNSAVVRRLRSDWTFVVESVLAAGLAWLLATRLLGVHPESFFAPASTMLVLGQIRGQRVRRALEVWGGVLFGILLAHAVRSLSDDPLVTVLVTVFALAALTVVTQANAIVVVQGSISALYVAVGPAGSAGGVSTRLVDVLVGGACALAISQVFTGHDPMHHVQDQLRATLAELARVLDDVRTAGHGGLVAPALLALADARRLDERVAALKTSIRGARESVVLRWGQRLRSQQVSALHDSLAEMDFAVRNVRVLARSGVILARSAGTTNTAIDGSLQELHRSVRLLSELLLTRLTSGGPTSTTDLRADDALQSELSRAVLRAVELAGRGLGEDPGLPTSMMAGQIRGFAVDVLRLAGMDRSQAPNQSDAALARGLTAAGNRPPGRPEDR